MVHAVVRVLRQLRIKSNQIMKRVIIILFAFTLSSCYSVSQVGNCKYYSPKNFSSKGKPNHLVTF